MSGTITDDQISATAAIATSKLADGANFIKRNGTVDFTANQSLGGFKITNLGDPTLATDAANKQYVDALAGSGLVVKTACVYATKADITLSGLGTQAGGDWPSTLTAGDRILVRSQATGSQNGIYLASASGWTRASDFNSPSNIIRNSFFWVGSGAELSDTGWTLATDPPYVVDTTALVFNQFNGAGSITTGTALSRSGNTLNVNLGDGLTTSTNNLTIDLADSTLSLDGTGLKLAPLTSAYLLVGNGSNVATGVAMSGDVTISNTGATTINSAFQKLSNFVYAEVPTGAINGTNTIYVIANTPVAGTVRVYLNGMRMNIGASNDYTISGSTITFNFAPSTNDVLLVDYMK